jgi:flagellar L-ring protein precursor FlgH
MRHVHLFVVFTIGVMLLGCNNMAPKRDPLYAPATPVVPREAPTGNGSIYQAGHAMTWFEDLRARRVGDLLTVRLVERTSGTKIAETSVAKDNSTSIGANTTILGVDPARPAPALPFVPANSQNSFDTSMVSSHAFDGTGDSKQSNSLSGEITVTVVEVLPNGNMMVRGEKRIGINKGNEYVKISGIVRPQDVDASNTVSSTKIADPTIVYVGDGAVADSNSMGWLAKFFLGALMPF